MRKQSPGAPSRFATCAVVPMRCGQSEPAIDPADTPSLQRHRLARRLQSCRRRERTCRGFSRSSSFGDGGCIHRERKALSCLGCSPKKDQGRCGPAKRSLPTSAKKTRSNPLTASQAKIAVSTISAQDHRRLNLPATAGSRKRTKAPIASKLAHLVKRLAQSTTFLSPLIRQQQAATCEPAGVVLTVVLKRFSNGKKSKRNKAKSSASTFLSGAPLNCSCRRSLL